MPPWNRFTTSHRTLGPVVHVPSMRALSWRSAMANASSSFPAVAAWIRSVTSVIDTSWLASMFGHRRSSFWAAAKKPFSEMVGLRRRQVLDALPYAVVIGHHQPGRGDEAGGAPVRQPDRPEPDSIEPLLGWREAVRGLDLGRGKIVEQPHPLVAESERGAGEHQQEGASGAGSRPGALPRPVPMPGSHSWSVDTADRPRRRLGQLPVMTSR